MEDEPVQPGYTQADMIREELNFDVDPNDPLTKAALSDHPENEWMDILGNGQLRKRVLTKGEAGTRPQKADICTLKIIGKLEDGTIVDEYEEAIIQLGDVELIQGLDLAIALMDVGEVAEIEVAPRFAYGNLGKAPLIPPAATITYTVTLMKVDLEKDVESLDVNERKRIGKLKRERGNWWFTRDEPELAIQCYRRALTFLTPTSTSMDEKEETISDAELQELLEDKIKIYNNLAAAQMKTQAYSAALKSVENVLNCHPNNVKALYRKGKILHHQGEYSLAYTTLLQAAKLEPETKCIQQELQALKEKNAKDVQQQKNLYRKMLGTNKATNNGSIKKYSSQENQKNTKSTKLMWSLLGGATAAMIGVLVYRFTS